MTDDATMTDRDPHRKRAEDEAARQPFAILRN